MPAKSGGVRLQRSPSLVCYWEDDRLIFHNYRTGVRITASPACAAILDLFDSPRKPREIVSALPRFSPHSIERNLAQLVSLSLLQETGEPNSSSSELDALRNWSPAATFFHLATKDAKYHIEVAESPERLRRFMRENPQPAFFKSYPGRESVDLPPVEIPGEGSFAEVLLGRRTWRQFGGGKLALAALSRLLYLSWGVTDYVGTEFLGRLPLKTSPSGGARHPIEAYVVPLRVEGLPEGIYHYASDRHRLECLRTGPMKRRVQQYLCGQYWYEDAAAVVFMTAVFDRVYWKYRFPRAYRTVLLDAGHVCQTFCLTATWLGLAPFCTAAFADSLIERDLGVDGIGESMIYVAGVGVRPRNSRALEPGSIRSRRRSRESSTKGASASGCEANSR